MKITRNEPAMPRTFSSHSGHNGLTIRQQFAMEFMVAFINNNTEWSKYPFDAGINYADELIKALNETPNPNL